MPYRAVPRKVREIGASAMAWSRAHPWQAALVAVAAIAGAVALASYASHRRRSHEMDGSSADDDSSDDDSGFEVEDLVTSQHASPPIPPVDGRSGTDEIAPTRERTTPSHHFRPNRLP